VILHPKRLANPASQQPIVTLLSSSGIIYENLSRLLDFLFDNQDIADILSTYQAGKQRNANRRRQDDTNKKRQQRPSLELLRWRRKLESWRTYHRMRSRQRKQVASVGRAKQRALRVQDTQRGDGSLRVNAAIVASLSKNGRLVFAKAAR
jgi:hypothetical protein